MAVDALTETTKNRATPARRPRLGRLGRREAIDGYGEIGRLWNNEATAEEVCATMQELMEEVMAEPATVAPGTA
jgi:hypothetical protein